MVSQIELEMAIIMNRLDEAQQLLDMILLEDGRWEYDSPLTLIIESIKCRVTQLEEEAESMI